MDQYTRQGGCHSWLFPTLVHDELTHPRLGLPLPRSFHLIGREPRHASVSMYAIHLTSLCRHCVCTDRTLNTVSSPHSRYRLSRAESGEPSITADRVPRSATIAQSKRGTLVRLNSRFTIPAKFESDISSSHWLRPNQCGKFSVLKQLLAGWRSSIEAKNKVLIFSKTVKVRAYHIISYRCMCVAHWCSADVKLHRPMQLLDFLELELAKGQLFSLEPIHPSCCVSDPRSPISVRSRCALLPVREDKERGP